MITQEYLKDILIYDKETGIFTWKVNHTCKSKIGKLAGSIKQNKYVEVQINKKRYYAHRLAWLYEYGQFPKQQLDHINNNPNDNRIENLREASYSQNGMNKSLQKNNKSGVKGVGWCETAKKWRARITINKIEYHLGLFSDLELAELVVTEARNKYHGEFARN
jgi:hypothetical protein